MLGPLILLLGCGGAPTEDVEPAAPPPAPSATARTHRADGRGATLALRRALRVARQDVDRHVLRDAETQPIRPWDLREAPDEADGELAALAALGYVDGVAIDDGRPRGTTIHRRDHTAGGWNLYTAGGHPGAWLVDMDGEVVWRWDVALEDVWPDARLGRVGTHEPWRRATMLPDGDVIGVWAGFGVVRVDAQGRVRWANLLPAHHDLAVLPDGGVITLGRDVVEHRGLRGGAPTVVDQVVYLDPEGRQTRIIDLLAAFRRHPQWEAVWAARRTQGDDVFHTNSVAVLDETTAHHGPAFRPGNLLLSMRHLGTVAILDPEAEAIVWVMKGPFAGQHDPRIVGPDRLLLYDNRSLGDASRLLEFDLETREVVWTYRGNDAHPFFSVDCGHAQRLADGHTLVNESAPGRAFELDAQRRIVWEHRSLHTLPDGTVSRFYEFRRVPPETDMGWLDAARAARDAALHAD